ncbi:hypothetical protein ABE057_12725 [Bacillus paralicheniformis]|uniref:hypothetical protein n=1 Tax=Bacillus paralicheniformis TaxID=1648923 RepID=UPI0035F5E3D0
MFQRWLYREGYGSKQVNAQCSQQVLHESIDEGHAQKAEGRFHRLDKIAGLSFRRIQTEEKRQICLIAYHGIHLTHKALHRESQPLNDEMLRGNEGHFSHVDLVLVNHRVTK